MPKGEKYNDNVRYRAFALLTACNNVRAVAKKLGLPESTVRNWKHEYEKNPDEVFAKVCAQKKREYAAKSFLAMDSAMDLMMRRMERAATQEDILDELCEAVMEGVENPTQAERKAIYAKFAAMRIDDVSKVCMTYGVLSDKLAASLADQGETNASEPTTMVFANPEEAAYAE